MTYVANARMYAVNPVAAAAWKSLFAWLARKSGVELGVIDHAFPAPLADLWSRPDLGSAFMCGLPFLQRMQKPTPIAAPVPRDRPSAGRPVYASHFVVKAESRFKSLEDTFGGRMGWTVEDSQSGFNAPRHHLLRHRSPDRPTLYRESTGPLYTPRRVIDAVRAGEIDVGPVDSYAFDLMRRHEPGLGERLRIVATTDTAPIPFLIASPGCPPHVAAALKSAILAFADDPATGETRDRLGLLGFAPVVLADYRMIADWEDEARAAGYMLPS